MDGEASGLITDSAAADWEILAGRDLTPGEPDFAGENAALTSLADAMGAAPGDLLSRLAELIIDLCGAGSAAVTLGEVTDKGERLRRWRATAGALARSGKLPAPDPAGICEIVATRDETLLLRPTGDGGGGFDPPIVEALLAPFPLRGQPDGAVWAISHDPGRRFGAEDARKLASLARFAATAHQAIAAQAELRASESRFRALVTCPGPVVFRTSIDGAILDAPGWDTLTTQARESYLGWGWLDIVHPDDLDHALAAWTRSLRTGEPTYMDYRLRDATGAWRWVSGYGVPVRGDDGEIVEWMGTVTDIHERREAEARRLAIVELADRLRDLEDPARIAQVAAEIIGRTLDVGWAAFGVLDPVTAVMTIDVAWTPAGAPSLPNTIPFPHYHAYREELDRGEPVVVSEAPSRRDEAEGAPAAGAASVIYRPLTAKTGPDWVLQLHSDTPRTWSAEALTFVREAAERARGAVERRRAEQDLRELAHWLEREVEARTAEWSRLWRNSRDLLLVMDRAGAVRAANPAWTTILGWSPEAVAGRRFTDFAHPGDHAATREALALAAGAESPSFETRFRCLDGAYRWISWVAAPEDDLIYATGRHITAEKEAAAALEETQTRLRTFFETSYQYRALIALDGVLLEANATALAAAGVEHEAVVGRPIWETPWFARTQGIPEALRAAVTDVAAGAVRRQDIYLRLPSAGWRWLDFTLRPLQDSRGAAVAIVLEAVDITERRETEAALRQSQKLEAMGQLTGGVAHDFNNLLTPIIGGLDLLQRRGVGGERERRLIDGALQSAERAKTLVQRLLAFARRQPLRTGPVNVGALIAGMTDLVASTSGPQIQVIADAPADLPPAQADANQLEMAILNLSVNARDAMPDGGELRIAAACETVGPGHAAHLRPGRYIRLSVRDTGRGMDEATLTRAIEPFFSTKGQGRGTGLGLSMAHGLASQLGGALTIASKPGQGATVELWLPVSAQSIEETPTAPAPEPTRGEAGRVLLVDDETLARASTAVMLAELGYEAVEAATAQEALAILDSGLAIDILVTDHLMPGMPGAELARAVRERRPDTPVLIVTGYAEALPTDMPHLSKPFRQADLAHGLAALMALTAKPGL